MVALIALLNGFYGRSGRFALFSLTVLVFAVVVLSFVTWVDRIARLGRVTNTVDRVEKAAATALLERGWRPTLLARPAQASSGKATDSSWAHPGHPIQSRQVGYLQRIDLAAMQQTAENFDLKVAIETLPGAFVTPQRILARVIRPQPINGGIAERVCASFLIGNLRTFDDDPRFGLVVLSEIASKALSPAINDPGTAIQLPRSTSSAASSGCSPSGRTCSMTPSRRWAAMVPPAWKLACACRKVFT